VTLSGGEVLFRLILPQNPPPHPGDPRLQRQPRGRRKLCAPPQGRPPEPIRSNPRLSINLGKTSTPPWG
jgi:hypothetical protein